MINMIWLRRKFLTGLVILLPTVLTGWILYRIFISVDNILRPIVERYPFLDIPGLGFFTVILLILAAGVVAGNFVGSKMIDMAEAIMTRIPLVSRVYTALKQMSEVFLRHERSVFKNAVLIEYPRHGIYAIGFVTSDCMLPCEDGTRTKYLNIFMPTTPNPTSGLFLMVRSNEVFALDCSVEEALKMVISGGAVLPSSGILCQPLGKDIEGNPG
ncbi:MAG: DUF502 domain-containing protein [Candidatus Krumholzibacteriota bacterium]|nr:DUF502 domain-containing protein [Candidatus Krumholzibacteriota bacterium]